MFSEDSQGIVRRLTLTLISCALTGCDANVQTPPDSAVSAAEVQPQGDAMVPVPVKHAKEMRFHGIVSGFNSVSKAFFQAGRVSALYVAEGQFVTAGTVLGSLYSPSLTEALTAARAALKKSKAESKLSLEELARGVRLFKKGVLSRQELDEIKRTFDVNNQNVKEAQTQVESLEKDIANQNIVAEQNGMIAVLHKRQGDFLEAGESLLRFESTDRQKARFEIPEPIALQISIGDKAKLYFPSLSQTLDVVAIEKSLPTSGELALHRVTFELQTPQQDLLGLRCELVVKVGWSDAYEIDYSALRYDNGGRAYVVSVHNQPHRIAVEVIDLTASNVVVQGKFSRADRLLIGGDAHLVLDLKER